MMTGKARCAEGLEVKKNSGLRSDLDLVTSNRRCRHSSAEYSTIWFWRWWWYNVKWLDRSRLDFNWCDLLPSKVHAGPKSDQIWYLLGWIMCYSHPATTLADFHVKAPAALAVWTLVVTSWYWTVFSNTSLSYDDFVTSTYYIISTQLWSISHWLQYIISMLCGT